MTDQWTGLRLHPLDVLFFRDGRPFSAASRVEGGMPMPQTLAGALRTKLLVDAGFGPDKFRAFRTRRCKNEAPDQVLKELGAPTWLTGARFRGPWLALDYGDRCEPLLPVPQNVAREWQPREAVRDHWVTAKPVATLPGWGRLQDARFKSTEYRPLWRTADSSAKHPGGYLTLNGVRAFLAGEALSDRYWLRDNDLYLFESRTGIAVNPQSLTAADGQIYGIQLLRLHERPRPDQNPIPRADCPAVNVRVCWYAEMFTHGERIEWHGEPIPWGGEGKHVSIDTVPHVDWPGINDTSVAPTSGGGCVWLLASAGIVNPNSRLPDRLSGLQLCGAATGRPLAVSGWDIARNGPNPTRFAVPGGSVFYTRRGADSNHVIDNHSLCSDPELVAQGWGFALKGAWNDC